MPTNFKLHPPSGQDKILASLYELFVDQHEDITPNTRKKHVEGFDKWGRFLFNMDIEDKWLTPFTQEQRTYLLSAFTSYCRQNKYDKENT